MPFPTVHHLNCHKNWAGKKCASYCYCQFSKLKVLYHHFRVFLIYIQIEFLKILFWAVTMTCGRYADESTQFTNNFKILKHLARIFFFHIIYRYLQWYIELHVQYASNRHKHWPTKEFKYTVLVSKNTIWHYICWVFFLKKNYLYVNDVESLFKWL